MRKLTKIIFFLLLCLNAHAGDSWTKEREKAKSLITQEKLAREVSFLTDSICQGRASGTRGSVEAAMWIRRKFEEAGLIGMTDSWTQGFNIRHGLNGRNVIGMLPGSKSIPCDRYIIVGAHYDHLGAMDGKIYPGADANASGTVAMLSIAEMLSAYRNLGKSHDSNVIFVAFDAKEYNMAGSKALWNMIENGSLKDPVSGETITKSKITMMVNIDQIGCTSAPLKSGRKDYIIMLGNESLKPIKRDMLRICNRMFAIDMEYDYTYYGSKNFTKMFYRLSDQRVFIDNGIPSVLFTSGITMNTNKTYDTPETIDLKILQKRIFLIYHWVDKML